MVNEAYEAQRQVFVPDHPHAIPVHCTLLSASQNART